MYQYIHVVTTCEQSHNFNGVAGIAIEDDKATKAVYWFRPDVQKFVIAGHKSPSQLGVLAQQADRHIDRVHKSDGSLDFLIGDC